ncbi:MAG TPA: GAF and ANTAR domain-containing protein [Aeromicrobium sp.]|nr:GAF and ANTAR domain-containing protein [Aeromicrobium sp.]
MDELGSLPRRIAEVARSLQAETGSVETMDLAVQLAVETIAGAEDASISLVHRGRIVETPAMTSDRARDADQLQYELNEGPLISAIWDEVVVSCPDLAADARWGEWGPRAAQQMGIGSVLSFRMFAAKVQLGALSVYSSRPHEFDGADVESGISFAAHTAIAVTVAQTDEHKDIALDSRSVIGQATGILMERFDLDAVRAFAALKRISQDRNVKLHELAVELVRTRRMPS